MPRGDRDLGGNIEGACFLRDNPYLRYCIKRMMKEKGLTKADMSRRLNLSEVSVGCFLEDIGRSGTKSLSQYQVLNFCKELGIDVSLTVRFV